MQHLIRESGMHLPVMGEWFDPGVSLTSALPLVATDVEIGH